MKKRYIALCIALYLLSLVAVAVNLFFISIPEFAAPVLSVLMLAALILFLIKGCGRRVSKTVLSIATVLMIVFILFCAYCNPYWNSITFRSYRPYNHTISLKEAKADLDYMMHYLKKDHPLFLMGIPADIEASYNEAVKELELADTITVTTLNQKLQSILSRLGDAHTSSYPNYAVNHYLKYIKSINDKGYNLIQVNGVELNKLFKQYSHLYSFEVESWGLMQLRQDLSSLEGLYFLGLKPESGLTYTYEDKSGELYTFTYEVSDFVTWEEYQSYNNITDSEAEPFVSYKVDDVSSLAVLRLKQCNYNNEYRSCLKAMFTEVRDKGIENVAVDIRGNSGGSSLVVNEFIKYLNVDSYKIETTKWRFGFLNIGSGIKELKNNKYDELLFDGRVYLLTSTSTFSSGMMFGEYIKDNRLGIIIGEAPGNTPTGYGDIATFMLPNSRLYVQISTKQFWRADRESSELLVVPDVECKAAEAMDMLLSMVEADK
ncbi:MAG: hypothetical protein GX942_01340 [Papillibacter sp.]|nr:hypothetical protein [Papillibacter sp.]